jgi:aspartate kinase
VYQHLEKGVPVVQKYGGTSVGDKDKIIKVAERVARIYRQFELPLVIVVSARSGDTNKLIALTSEINANTSFYVRDLALAAGEQLSVALLSAALEAQGIKPDPLLAFQLGIRTDRNHSRARIKSINTDRLAQSFREKKIPVVAGFQGINDDLSITTLGRGGSDTSAVALACALKAGFCEINTDVDGVFSADPNIVASAKIIPTLHYDVALEMASLGSKVLHPRSVELGAKFNIPIIVRNSFSDNDSVRTVVMSETTKESRPIDIEATVVSGVSIDKEVVKLTLENLPKNSQAIARIFSVLSGHQVNIDVIVHDRNRDDFLTLGFTVSESDREQALAALKCVKVDGAFSNLNVLVQEGLEKVSIVGVGMRSATGVASRTFSALAACDIDIHMISTSEIKISCVVDRGKGEIACQCLHEEFLPG